MVRAEHALDRRVMDAIAMGSSAPGIGIFQGAHARPVTADIWPLQATAFTTSALEPQAPSAADRVRRAEAVTSQQEAIALGRRTEAEALPPVNVTMPQFDPTAVGNPTARVAPTPGQPRRAGGSTQPGSAAPSYRANRPGLS